jgi:hypothetical protein
MRLRRCLSRASILLGFGVLGPSCYTAGNGTAPPGDTFYYPVGLGVSLGGNVLYAVNSDFDLQWNGGTLQSYDLHLIRKHALLAIKDPTDPNLPLAQPAQAGCPNTPPVYTSSGTRQPLTETCAPPVYSQFYVRDSAVIGAFATDLQLSTTTSTDPAAQQAIDGKRLYVPVRGDASLTWADLTVDDPNVAPPEDPSVPYAPFALDCGTRVNNLCDAAHHAGNNPNEPGNTRNVTLPGEPFGMAQSEDGTTIVITHQTAPNTSLLLTGLAPSAPPGNPSLQFVVGGLPLGGVGVTSVPHDPLAFGCAPGAPCPAEPRPAFLETYNQAAEVDLFRFYSDISNETTSSVLRPFLVRESAYPVTANAGGTDSRGIVIDPTPRIACEAAATTPAELEICAQRPARVFFANRSPPSLVIGEIGEPSASGDGTYDPDRLVIYDSVPLEAGASKVFLGPVVDKNGNYALRVFIVCFDSSLVYAYDPDDGTIENQIYTGPGPFAMAFDPFDIRDVALHKPVPFDPREPGTGLRSYRFAYLGSFTNSYVQLIDLDDSIPNSPTYETVVFNLGVPTSPVGQ